MSTTEKTLGKPVDNVKGAAILMLAALGFATMVALIKFVGQRLPVTQILFLRQLGMIAMLMPFLVRTFPQSLKTDYLSLQLLRIFLALVAMLSGFTAVINMPLADATAIAFAKSFFVTIFAVTLLKETVGLYRWSAVFVGFIGVMVMVRPGTDGFSHYSLLAIIGAACAGLVMVIIRKLTRVDSATTILAYQAIGVGLIMSVPAFIFWVPPTPHEWLLLGAIGVVSYFAQKANIVAFSYGEASLLASLDYVRLLYATIFGWFVFNEMPSPGTWAGAAIIILAAVFTVYRERKLKQQLASHPDARSQSLQ